MKTVVTGVKSRLKAIVEDMPEAIAIGDKTSPLLAQTQSGEPAIVAEVGASK